MEGNAGSITLISITFKRQTNSQLWMEFNGSVDEHDFHVEFAYGKTDVPRYATSPAYPPNDPNSSYVPNIHPGLQRLFAQFLILKVDGQR